MREVSIEALLAWAYRDQCVLEVERAGTGFALSPRCSLAAFEDLRGLGVIVRAPRCLAPAPDPHPDAASVHSAVSLIGEPMVINHARAGDRPDPMTAPVRRWYPHRDPAGRVLVEYYEPDGRQVWPARGDGAAYRRLTRICPCRVRPSDGEVRARRADYRRWWRALRDIHRCLAAPGMLRAHRLRVFDVPAL